MRRLALAALLALAAACSTPPCEELGKRICSCQSGMTADTCKTQVQDQLKDLSPDENFCQARLDECHQPAEAVFCEWLLTEDGKTKCGLTPTPPQTP